MPYSPGVKSRKISLHPEKCAAMRYTLSLHQQPNYTLEDYNVQPLDQHRDLGVFLLTDLSWIAHYKKICCNGYCSLYLIRHSFSSALLVNLKRDLYLAVVKPQLTYCSQVWRPKPIKEILLLERIQRRGTKFILNDYKSDYKSRLNSTRLLPLM